MKNNKITVLIIVAMLSSMFAIAISTVNTDEAEVEILDYNPDGKSSLTMSKTLGVFESESLNSTIHDANYFRDRFNVQGTFGADNAGSPVTIKIMLDAILIASGITDVDNDGSFNVSILKEDLMTGEYEVVAICQPTGVPILKTTSTLTVYKITWSVENDETHELYSQGLLPEYKGAVEWDSETTGMYYTIADWSPEITTVNADCTYIAEIEELYADLTVTFMNAYDSVFYTQTVSYGSDAIIPTDIPEKISRTHDYVFDGWLGELNNITENVTVSPEYIEVSAEMMSMAFSVSYDSMIFASPYIVEFNKNGFDLEPYGYSEAICNSVTEGATLTHLFVAAHEDKFGTQNVSSSFVFGESGWTSKFWDLELDDSKYIDMTYFLEGIMIEETHITATVEEGSYAEANIFNYFINGTTTFDKLRVETDVNDEITLTVPTSPDAWPLTPQITYEDMSLYYTTEPVKDTNLSDLFEISAIQTLIGDDYAYTFSFPAPGTYYVCAYREAAGVQYEILADVFGAPVSWCVVTVTGHTVTFDSNGGIGSIDDAHVSEGTELSLPTEGLSRAGHILAGWSLTSDGDLITDAYTITSDTTLYAIWDLITYDDIPSDEVFNDIIEQNTTPVVNMKSSAVDSVLKDDIFRDLTKSLVVNVLNDDGKVLYSWTFDGEYKENAGIFKPGISPTLPDDDLKEVIKNAKVKNSLVLNFAASGELPNNATVSYYVGDVYEDGTVLSLLFYDEDTKKLEEVAEDLTVSNGTVSFEITHCSMYILAEPISDVFSEDNIIYGVVVILAGILITVVAVFLLRRPA